MLAWITPRAADAAHAAWITDPAIARVAAQPGLGHAMIDGGHIVGAGGVMPIWHGRAYVWLVVGAAARPRHLALALRHALAWFAALQASPAFRRIEATVVATHAAGARFLRRLGFVREDRGGLDAFDPDGNTHQLFARIARTPA